MPGSSIRPRSEYRDMAYAFRWLPVATQWRRRRKSRGVDADAATKSNDGNVTALDHRSHGREVDAQAPGGVGHREEQWRLRRATWPHHGLLARLMLMSSPSRTHPPMMTTTSPNARQPTAPKPSLRRCQLPARPGRTGSATGGPAVRARGGTTLR
jgi:hypothetical protein